MVSPAHKKRFHAWIEKKNISLWMECDTDVDYNRDKMNELD
jgi:hypothetical protein